MFNNPRNFRHSLFSGIGMASVAELDQNVQALLGGHRRVVACIGFIGILEAGKNPDRLLHARIIASRPHGVKVERNPDRRRGHSCASFSFLRGNAGHR
jgi:hypothetical protein